MRTKSISALRRRGRRPGKPLRHGGALCAPSLGNMLTSGRYRLKSRQAACQQKDSEEERPHRARFGPCGGVRFLYERKGGGGPQAAALWSQAPRCRAGQGGAGFHRGEKPGGRCPGNPDFKGQVAPPQMSAPGCGRKGGRRPPSACTAGSPTLSQSLMNSRTSPMNTPPNQGNLKRGFLSLSHGGGAPSRGERAAWGLSSRRAACLDL